MIEFQDKYIDDANDLLEKLESELIDFEQTTDKEKSIQELFRVMHTLKGSAGMFGFSRIEKFTHVLEDIYDLIRNHQLEINNDIINLTFSSIDVIKQLLTAKEIITQEQENLYLQLLTTAQTYSNIEIQTTDEHIKQHDNTKSLLYKVLFNPAPNVLLRGIKPQSVIDELIDLGRNIYYQYTNSQIEENENSFNKYWEIFIEGSINYDDIEEAFLFFDETEFKIESLASLSKKNLDEFISKTECVKNGIDKKELLSEINKIISDKNQTKKQALPEQNEISIQNKTRNEESIKVPVSKLNNLLNAVSDLIILHSKFDNLASNIQNEDLNQTVLELSKLSRFFRDEVLLARLIPIGTLKISMQRMVRDVSNRLNKQIEFVTEGMQTELDKSIIDNIEKPIMHIIRNSIDHGIEMPEERIKNEKNPIGTIRLFAYYAGSSVFIQIQDDGKGIDTEKVRQKALSKQLISASDEKTDDKLLELLFEPGFSTSDEISEISGRGVGLDVVKNTINELHGEINIETEVGLGTSFTLKLPITLSITDALLVNCAQYKILIPVSNIEFCKYIQKGFFNNKLQYKVNGKIASVKRLSDVFECKNNDTEFETLIVFNIYEKYFGLLVNKIMNTMQAVIKPLGHLHSKQSYFIGMSTLGDGSSAYILDINYLFKKNLL